MTSSEIDPSIITQQRICDDDRNHAAGIVSSAWVVVVTDAPQEKPELDRAQKSIPISADSALEGPFVDGEGRHVQRLPAESDSPFSDRFGDQVG